MLRTENVRTRWLASRSLICTSTDTVMVRLCVLLRKRRSSKNVGIHRVSLSFLGKDEFRYGTAEKRFLPPSTGKGVFYGTCDLSRFRFGIATRLFRGG